MSIPTAPTTASEARAAHERPIFAIVANSQAPYRLHVHRRIARELTEVELHSLFTLYANPDAPWAPNAPAEINPVSFADAPTPAGRFAARRAAWRKSSAVIDWLRRSGVSAVLVNGYGDASSLRAIIWCARRGVPVMMWGDSNIRDETGPGRRLGTVGRWVKRRLLGWVLPKLSAVLACGRRGREYFESYGADPDRIFYHPVEPDYDLIARLPPEAIERARVRFGLGPNRRRFVYSGRLARIKRVDQLIDAFAAVAERRPDWDLVLIGDGDLRAELQGRVPAHLVGRVTWTGFVDDQELVSGLYRLGDVLVLPSVREPWALVINEAAAAGLAIVASDVVGAGAELVRDKLNGRIYPAGDLAALTDCLLDVSEPTKIDAMKAASAQVLRDWRRDADPIDGLRAALRACGVIPQDGSRPWEPPAP